MMTDHIEADEIHVWCARLEASNHPISVWWRALSAAERARAESFYFERHRTRYIAAHGILREILSRYAGLPPAALRLGVAPQGKPKLCQSNVEAPLSFNLSHSGGAALYAIARNREVGVDVEEIKSITGMEEVARSTFSKREWDDFCSLAPEEREAAFYRSWTRKEAVVKSLGMGLFLPLETFDVSVKPQESPRVLANRIPGHEGLAWTLCDVTPYPGFWGAAAATGAGARIILREWVPWTCTSRVSSRFQAMRSESPGRPSPPDRVNR